MRKITVSLYGSLLAGDKRHAQTIMSDLGVTYKRAEAIPLGDQWQFFGVENVPEVLPDYVTLVEE